MNKGFFLAQTLEVLIEFLIDWHEQPMEPLELKFYSMHFLAVLQVAVEGMREMHLGIAFKSIISTF